MSTSSPERPQDYDEMRDAVKYVGVRVLDQKKGLRFKSELYVNGKTQHIGVYKTIEEAVDAHDHAAIEAGCPTSSVNFKKNIPMNYQPKKKLRKNNTSNCTGVNKKRNGTYQVQIRMNYRSLVWTFDNYADAQRQAANVIRKQEDLKQQNQEPAYTYFDNKKILKKRKK